MESQNKKIKEWLLSGRSITAMEALYQFGCFRLGARINDLRREGMKITTTFVEIRSPSVFNGKKHVAKYSLKKQIQ